MPRRSFESVSDFEAEVASAEELIFDGTENLSERPQDSDKQQDKYSGKKGTHTDLALVLSDKNCWIYYLSSYYAGRNVDLGVLKQEFEPGQGWFRKHRVLFDLGFVGVAKLYAFKELVIGEKKPRKSKKNPKPKLSKEQKQKNKQISKERIYVEHAIGRMKKYRILKNRCRTKCQEMKNTVIGICAGLSNYQLLINQQVVS